MTTATAPLTFPLFSTLAPELRDKIWQEALPSEFSPSLYSYKKGCWQPRIFTRSDPGYCDEVSDVYNSEDLNRNFEFRHELLDDVKIETPLLFVNHEARDIALAWALKLGMKIKGETASPTIVRRFDPNQDILHVPHHQWNDFYNEPFDRSFEDDMIDLNHGTFNEVTRIAVPESLFWEDVNSLSELYMYFSIKVLYIIVDEPRDLRYMQNNSNLQPRWELREFPAGYFIWDDEKKSFEVKDGDDNWDKSLHDLIIEVGNELGKEIIEGRSSLSEIRPVFAVKK
ncbi:hypothetical protein EYC80_009307 [Monilinia laxa]|uniref:2EXR domain-containing protein n=1 Tax=Monilinia laxa TaxID=61186 RepID=A0A5N6JXF9_MONLA|nr:hypothetical protein EYC80_009307 [Monilinia laxa]